MPSTPPPTASRWPEGGPTPPQVCSSQSCTMWPKFRNKEKRVSETQSQDHSVKHMIRNSLTGASPAPPSPVVSSATADAALSDPIYAPLSPQVILPKVGDPDRVSVDVAGLPVYVYGMQQLTASDARGTPEVCIVIHMHGRTGSARKEDTLARELWRNTMAARSVLAQGSRMRDFLLVTFDQRNHGERMTHAKGQKTWKDGNANHA